MVTGSAKERKRHTIGQYNRAHFMLAMAREEAKDVVARERPKKSGAPHTTFNEALEIYYRVHLPTIAP